MQNEAIVNPFPLVSARIWIWRFNVSSVFSKCKKKLAITTILVMRITILYAVSNLAIIILYYYCILTPGGRRPQLHEECHSALV
jgi:hypothetical protein